MTGRATVGGVLRWILAGLVAALVAVIGLGSYIGDETGRWSSLKSNLPSEMLGLVMSVVVTVLVVDWLVDWHRRREWRSVREHVSAAITRHVADIASEYLVMLGIADRGELAQISAGRLRPDTEALAGLDSLLRQLARADPEQHRQAASELYEEVKWDLERLASILLLRGLHVQDKQLASAMSLVDARAADWHNAVVAQKRAAVGSSLPQASAVLEALRDLYAVVLRTTD